MVHHLLKSNNNIPGNIKSELRDLLEEDKTYSIVRDFDHDLFKMPRLPILMLLMPATKMTIKKNDHYSRRVNEGCSITELCITKVNLKGLRPEMRKMYEGFQKERYTNLENLRKQKIFRNKVSTYEKQIARGEIIPTGKNKVLKG